MLRQAPGGNRPAKSSIVCPPVKKKKLVAQAAKKVSDPTLASPFASTSASTSATSTEQDAGASLHFSRAELDIEVEPVVPHIIHELKGEEEDMATNL